MTVEYSDDVYCQRQVISKNPFYCHVLVFRFVFVHIQKTTELLFSNKINNCVVNIYNMLYFIFVLIAKFSTYLHSPLQRLFGVFSRLFSWLTGRFKFIKENSGRANGLTGGVLWHMERIGFLNCKRARKDGKRAKEKRSFSNFLLPIAPRAPSSRCPITKINLNLPVSLLKTPKSLCGGEWHISISFELSDFNMY